jgi:hypothetical protein
LPKLGGATIAIVDELDKLDPSSSAMIPPQAEGYLSANHIWNARDRRIHLFGGRNEFVAFQIVLGAANVQPLLMFEPGFNADTTFRRYGTVAAKGRRLPDPLASLSLKHNELRNQSRQSLHCEIYIPHDANPGEHSGVLTLQSNDEKIEFAVTLTVWDFTLPDALSFLPEMNAYGLPASERGYYRLSHRNRTFVNVVPYSQSGKVADGWAPVWKNGRFDWSAWDERFGPYFSGTAFADLPRKGVPLPAFYLPMHENWPMPMEGNYNGDYWADRAFPKHYLQALVEASRQFAEHLSARAWNKTLFLGFLNNKVDFKKNGWSRGSSPWTLDEPSSFQDYWALRYFGSAFHEGWKQARGTAKLVFRADISRPMWQRDSLDGLLDYNVVSGEFRRYRRMVLDRKRDQGQVLLEYGAPNAVEDSNVHGAAWCVDAWSLGADGVVPWLTIGTDDAWTAAETTCLFYPPRGGESDPTPSVRLKSYLRGEQDVEYLTLLAEVLKEPRWAIGDAARKALKLRGERRGTGFTGGEDAGIVTYDSLRPQDLWALRMQIGETLSQAKPAPRTRLVDFRTPPRDPANLPNRFVGP